MLGLDFWDAGKAVLQPGALGSSFQAPCPRCPSGVQLPGPAARDALRTLPWTSVNSWLGFLALQGLQPSVTRE